MVDPAVDAVEDLLTSGRERLDAAFAACRRDGSDRGYRRYLYLTRLAYPEDWATERAVFLAHPTGGELPPRFRTIIEWLIEDPFGHRTGYEKQVILVRLRQFTFAREEADLVRTAILGMLARGSRQEFREVRRLARRVDSAPFRRKLRRLARTADAGTAERARLTLGLLERQRQRRWPGGQTRWPQTGSPRG